MLPGFLKIEMIKIIDCGSQLTQNIARRVRELGVYTEIVPFNTKASDILNGDLEGIIISGGQFSVYDENAPIFSRNILKSRVPILGICYGQQSIAYLLGGKVSPVRNREYGRTLVRKIEDSPILVGISSDEFNVWMSHGDIVEELPKGFRITSRSENNHISSIEDDDRKIYAVQFHPEVDHTEYGREILDNFLNVCDARRNWDPEKDYDRIVAETEEKIKERQNY